eukprot:g1791.t1
MSTYQSIEVGNDSGSHSDMHQRRRMWSNYRALALGVFVVVSIFIFLNPSRFHGNLRTSENSGLQAESVVKHEVDANDLDLKLALHELGQTASKLGAKVDKKVSEAAKSVGVKMHAAEKEEKKHAAEKEEKKVSNEELEKKVKHGNVVLQSLLDKEYQLEKGVVFVGHSPPDTDSVFSAIGAAYLYDGIPAVGADPNPESMWCLNHFNLPLPAKSNISKFKGARWGLVDHGSKGKVAPGVVEDDVVAVIDHHQLAADEVDQKSPIFVSIRPWGSACTILAYQFADMKKDIPYNVAGGLMCAILSDTLNLRSPTTTQYDRDAVDALGAVTGLDTKEKRSKFVTEMFRAKSNTDGMTAKEIYLLDFKVYTVGSTKIGWGSGETVDLGSMVSLTDKLIAAMKEVKQEKGLDLMYFSITNIDPSVEKPYSVVVLSDPKAAEVAKKAFPHGTIFEGHKDLLSVGPLVSRKKQFIPAMEMALTGKN